jgi:hypothetical protein
VSPRAILDIFGEEKILFPLPRIEAESLACLICSLVTIVTELFRLLDVFEQMDRFYITSGRVNLCLTGGIQTPSEAPET